MIIKIDFFIWDKMENNSDLEKENTTVSAVKNILINNYLKMETKKPFINVYSASKPSKRKHKPEESSVSVLKNMLVDAEIYVKKLKNLPEENDWIGAVIDKTLSSIGEIIHEIESLN